MGKIKTLKNWDFYTALSNRRLSVNNFYTCYKLDWSIDRITIVGELQYDLDEVGELLVRNGFAKESFNGFNLIDEFQENIAYFEMVKFQEGKGRFDFNPNKIGTFIQSELQNFVHELFIEPHFSRADVACDIYNLPDELIKQYELAESLSYQPYFSRGKDLQTMYWGSRSSERQVRLYNKLVEQGRKNEYIIDDVKTWWRLEIQLRRGKATDWKNNVDETLENFAALEFMPLDWTGTEKVMLTGLMTNPDLWNELSRPSKYKYRDMLKEIAKHDELTIELKKSFEEYHDELKVELDSWLRGIDVTE